ncbi:MAG: ATP-binding protein [Akkermansia sp.]|nr:ATP-binding protein [Akkermansia sp.]MBQ9829952.1 ATP-binding protein [Akkermansia sp.]
MKQQGYIPRAITAHVQKLMSMYPVVTIAGPRQSGKTTLARHLYPEYDYVSMEDLRARQYFYQDPTHFLEQHKAPCIFDEVQNTPELLSYLQGIVDEENRPGMYILTGSRQMELQETVTQSLAGRTGVVDLLPLSMQELKDAGIHLGRDEMLFTGCLPRVYEMGLDPQQVYLDYWRTYLERDVRQIVNVRSLKHFELFLKLLATRVGQVVNCSSLATDVGVSSSTIGEWLSVLEASYVIFTLYPYYKNYGKRLTKSPKIYFTEPGVIPCLLDIETPAQLGRDPLLGHIFENMVVVEALKARFNAGKRSNLYFFRDTRGFEIDLILEEHRRPRPVEIKAGMTFTPAMVRNVQHFAEIVEESLPPCLVYGGDTLGMYHNVQVDSFADMTSVINRE